MNRVFSLKRFGMLLKKHTIENYRGYLMSLVVLFGILALTMAVPSYHSFRPMTDKTQVVYFILFLIIAGTIFTSNVFINLGDKRKAIATLTLPCTSFEKFLVGWMYSYLIFQVLFIGVFYSVLIPVLHMGSWPASSIHMINVFSGDNVDIVHIVFIGYAFLHSVVLLGAIFFKKMHFIKTAFAFFITGAIIVALNNKVLELILAHDLSGNPPFTSVYARSVGNDYAEVKLAPVSEHWVMALFIVLSVIIWSAAYFRLKEKQV